MHYCCPIWGSSKKAQTIIEKSQKRIAGIILNKSSSKIDTNTLKDMHWLTFEKRCNYHYKYNILLLIIVLLLFTLLRL